ncbi:MAG: DUF4252 domain-containing protein [Acidobacteriota bacterium]
MARILILAVMLLPLGAQHIDYSLFDRLAEKAKESAVVNLGPEQLSLLAGMQPKEGGRELADLVKTLKGIQVRSLEFDSPGQYDLNEVRALGEKIKGSGTWVPLITVKEKGEFTEILIRKGADGKSDGLLILAAEPKELTLVHIDGVGDIASLAKLGGLAGIPEIAGALGGAKKSGPKKAPAQKKDDE